MTDEREYFCECIRECEKGMYALAFGILKNEEDAADIMQESIIKAYCNLDALRDKKKFRPWIMSIVHNTAIEFIKKKKPMVDIESQWDLSEEDPCVDAETKLTVWEAVQKLKLPYRTIVILFYYENCSVRQIANITSASEPAVRQQLLRARKMLAKLLDKEDFTA